MSQPIPTTPQEIAAAINALIDLHEGCWAGCGIPFDWNPLTDGIREFLSENLQRELPKEIEEVCAYEEIAEIFTENYPSLAQQIRRSSFAENTLGTLLKNHLVAAECLAGSSPIPTTPNEVAKAIIWLINLHAGNLDGLENRFVLTDGIRDYLSKNLESIPAKEIEDVLEYEFATEELVTTFPALIQRIQPSSFAPNTLGLLIKERTKNIEYASARERLKAFKAAKLPARNDTQSS